MKTEREIRRFVEEMGGKVIRVAGTKHWKIDAEVDGVEISVVMSRSPSDQRAILNQRATFRRLLKQRRS